MPDKRLYKKTILVIEDNPPCLALLKAFFKGTGADILIANTGKEAWRLFTENVIDLVLADLKLPDQDGTDLVKKFKKKHPHIPVIVQTACTFDLSKEKCAKAGCDLYVTKPYTQKHFMDSVFKTLEKSSSSYSKIRTGDT